MRDRMAALKGVGRQRPWLRAVRGQEPARGKRYLLKRVLVLRRLLLMLSRVLLLHLLHLHSHLSELDL